MHGTLETLIRGLAHQCSGRLAEAALLYRSVPRDDPHYPLALTYRGLAALAGGEAPQAAIWLERAAALRPDHVATMVALARALLASGRMADARDAADRTVACDPGCAEGWFLAGTASSATGDPERGIACLRHAIRLAPGHASAHLNLGNALADLDRFDEAEACMGRAAQLDPRLAEAHASLGWLFAGQGRLEEAKQACHAAIALRPDFAQAHWNLSFAHLLGGEFEAGWREYEWRRQQFPRDFVALPGPQWQGEALAGRTILVQAEQGLGDTIQLSRFLPLLAGRGATVVLACAAPLVPLLASAPGVTRAVARGASPGEYDVWIDQMSLPRLLGTRVETIPGSLGTLRADPGLAAAWDRLLPTGIRVGLAWSGNPLHRNDRRRSLPTQALAPLIGVPGLRFVSLQVGPRAAEITEQFGIADRSADLTDFAATAALVANLDVVIAADTSTAHLAGALGVPVWVMLPHAPDWRWMTGRRDTPWYRSMRLFRQDVPGDWSGPIAAIASALAARYRSRLKYAVAAYPTTALTAVTTTPQVQSASETATDQPRMVERLVMS